MLFGHTSMQRVWVHTLGAACGQAPAARFHMPHFVVTPLPERLAACCLISASPPLPRLPACSSRLG